MLTSVPPGLQQEGSGKILPLLPLFVICVHLKYTDSCHHIAKTATNHFVFWIFLIVARICELFFLALPFFPPNFLVSFISSFLFFFFPRLLFQINRCMRIKFMRCYVLIYPQNSVLCYWRTQRLVTPNRLMSMCVYRKYQLGGQLLPSHCNAAILLLPLCLVILCVLVF